MSLRFNEVQKSLCQRLTALARLMGKIAVGAALYTVLEGCAVLVDDPYYYRAPPPPVYYSTPRYIAPRPMIIFDQPVRHDVLIFREGHHLHHRR